MKDRKTKELSISQNLSKITISLSSFNKLDINEKNELLMEKIGTLIYENMDYNKSEETSKEQKVMKKTR